MESQEVVVVDPVEEVVAEDQAEEEVVVVEAAEVGDGAGANKTTYHNALMHQISFIL